MTKLQAARQQMGLTVLELSLLVGMDPSSVNRIERGKQICHRDKAKVLAAVLGVDVLDVIFNEPVSEN